MKKINLKKYSLINLISEDFNELEVDEMARPKVDQDEILDEPIKIPASEIVFKGENGSLVPYTGEITSLDPESGAHVPDMVIGNVVLLIGGSRVLKFKNLATSMFNFIQLSNNRFFVYKPKNKEHGNSTYNPGRDPLEDRTIAKKLIFKLVNDVFQDENLVHKLALCQIPTIVADYKHTQPTTNVLQTFEYGHRSPNIKFELHSKADIKDNQTAAELAVNNIVGDNGLKIPKPDYQRRLHAGEIYRGGKWVPTQGTDDYEKHGGETPIYHLKKKSIQLEDFNVFTDLNFYGGITDTYNYGLNATFSAQQNCKEMSKSRGTCKGNLFPDIRIATEGELPFNIREMEGFNLVNYPDFYTDLFKDVLRQLYEKIMEINVEDVLSNLVPPITNDTNPNSEFVDQGNAPQLGPGNQDDDDFNEFGDQVFESKKKKIKLTESQLKKVISNLTEQEEMNVPKYDDVLQTKQDNVQIEFNDLKILFSLSKNWCIDRDENPDCIEVESIKHKYNLYD